MWKVGLLLCTFFVFGACEDKVKTCKKACYDKVRVCQSKPDDKSRLACEVKATEVSFKCAAACEKSAK